MARRIVALSASLSETATRIPNGCRRRRSWAAEGPGQTGKEVRDTLGGGSIWKERACGRLFDFAEEHAPRVSHSMGNGGPVDNRGSSFKTSDGVVPREGKVSAPEPRGATPVSCIARLFLNSDERASRRSGVNEHHMPELLNEFLRRKHILASL